MEKKIFFARTKGMWINEPPEKIYGRIIAQLAVDNLEEAFKKVMTDLTGGGIMDEKLGEPVDPSKWDKEDYKKYVKRITPYNPYNPKVDTIKGKNKGDFNFTPKKKAPKIKL